MTTPEAQRILVVDDEPDIRRILQLLLEKHGHAVTAVGNCQEAIACVSRQEARPFRVAIIDIRLPDGSGVEVVKTVKQLSPQTICLVITAFPSGSVETDARAAGADQYFTKPFSIEQLMSFIQQGTMSP